MTTQPAAPKIVRVAVDAMGGDNAPGEVVKGAIAAAREGVAVLLVGSPEKVQPLLDASDITGLPIRLVPSDDAVEETQQPALELRRRPRASIAVATALVKQGQADAVVSMGSTGATMVAAVTLLGIMEGIDRPVLGGPFIGFAPKTFGVDLGTNVDCKPSQFLDFAAIGTVFCREYLDIPDPTVALVNVGAEEGKGNRQVKEAYDLLKKSGLNFIGNIEPHDMVMGKANVVLADGFVGNLLLKFIEGLGEATAAYLRERLAPHIGEKAAADVARDIMLKTNVLQTLGGPLWGINGVSIVGHGRYGAPEVKAAIDTAKIMVDRHVVDQVRQTLTRVRAGGHA